MHAVGIHSALAIKRQRKRRDEQKRARERRYSVQSSESGDTQHSPHGSTRRGYHPHSVTHAAGNGMLDTKVIANAIGRKGQATDKSGCACVHVRIYIVCNWKRVLSIEQVVTSIGMLHIGVVFVVFGIFLIGSGILPDDISQWDIWGRRSPFVYIFFPEITDFTRLLRVHF